MSNIPRAIPQLTPATAPTPSTSAIPAPICATVRSPDVVDSYETAVPAPRIIPNTASPMTWGQWLASWLQSAKQALSTAGSGIGNACLSLVSLVASLFHRIFVAGAHVSQSRAQQHSLFQDQSDGLFARIRQGTFPKEEIQNKMELYQWTFAQKSEFLKLLEDNGVTINATDRKTKKGKAAS